MASLVDAAKRAAVMKDMEIERAWGLNRALVARLRGVQAQALAWRDAALSNRAEATALRAELERASSLHRRRRRRLPSRRRRVVLLRGQRRPPRRRRG